ncbi:MAG: hypothetical protein FWJ90_20070 [Actinomadura sp.]
MISCSVRAAIHDHRIRRTPLRFGRFGRDRDLDVDLVALLVVAHLDGEGVQQAPQGRLRQQTEVDRPGREVIQQIGTRCRQGRIP